MEEKWWSVQDRDDAVGNGSDSQMENKPSASLRDQTFVSVLPDEASPVGIAIIYLSVFVLVGGGVLTIVREITAGDWLEAIFGVGFLVLAYFPLYMLFMGRSEYRLRVKHSTDSLIFESVFHRFRWLREEKRLSEALYLGFHWKENLETHDDGHTSGHAWTEYNVHGRSAEGDWELKIRDVVTCFENRKQKAREIADAIGVEFREFDKLEDS
tara:strand:- start:337 stop:972 length:636 start_codon:yes stop_codon:yes gene_type:complete